MVATEKTKQYKVIGTRPVRPDGTDKVTGRAIYGADFREQGMLFGRVKRSPHAHAIIKRIDASKALAIDGVHAVITAADFPAPGDQIIATYRGREPLQWHVDRVMASRKVLHRGHPVAAVCASDAHIAEDALDLIDVEYEPLPPVMNVREAMLPSAPILHDAASVARIEGLFDQVDGRDSNIARRLEMRLGDVETGFAEAEIVIEHEFETGTAHQGYIEPQNGAAYWSPDGGITVWTSTQGAFGVRQQMAQLLQVPVATVKVVPMEIGGGFGGKLETYLEPLAALLSKRTGRPVKMSMSRTEVLEATGPTSATVCRVKIGAKRDGTLVAGEAHLYYEGGAYPNSPVGAGARCAFASYAIPHQYVEGFDVVVNKARVMAYRAPGSPQASFAVESVLDEIAERLELDPVELRLKNAAREGIRRADGGTHGVIGAEEVLQAVQASDHYRSELEGPDRGRGIAAGYWFNGGQESSAYANVNADGTVSLVLGSVDIGGQRAALAMEFAETMGISYDDVKPHVVDTDSIGYTGNTGGSRTTFATGWAVYEAAMDVRRQLEQRAAVIWDVSPEQVHYGADAILRGPDDQQISFKEFAAKLSGSGGMIVGRADVVPSGVGPALAAHIVDVEVDRETGKVDIVRYTAVQDVGTAIHPSYVEGQMQGGAAQGAGMALSEEYVFDDEGQMRNASLLDYRMPTALDLPMIETVLVEVPNPGHPYGVRGVGEVPIVPPLAAIANAIHDATGVRIRRLPASPRAVLEALASEDGEA